MAVVLKSLPLPASPVNLPASRRRREKEVSVEYISACVPDPKSAVWATGQGSSGLVGRYFNFTDLSGSPVATRVDTELNFASFDSTNVPVSNPSSFSAIWTGTVQPAISGDQVFKVASGGFVRLYVNNQQIIDNFSELPKL